MLIAGLFTPVRVPLGGMSVDLFPATVSLARMLTELLLLQSYGTFATRAVVIAGSKYRFCLWP